MEATMISTDRIEQEIRLTATRARVWRALTIPTQFGKWFGVALSGDSVKPGMVLRGTKLSQGCGDNTFEATVEDVQPESRFSLRWHPYSTEPVIDGPEASALLRRVITSSAEISSGVAASLSVVLPSPLLQPEIPNTAAARQATTTARIL